MLWTRAVRSISEKRRDEYVHVGSRPASMRDTVSEIDLTARVLECGTQISGWAEASGFGVRRLKGEWWAP